MGGINEIVLTVAYITLMKAGAPIGGATGFFYTSSSKLFLVTNQHVFVDAKKNSYPDHFKLLLHVDQSDTRKNREYDIALYSSNTPLWKTHPGFPNADVALIELDQADINNGGYLIKSFSKEAFLPGGYRVDPGDDVFIMGYPLSFFDRKNNLPIFRNAMVASSYSVAFQGNPFFLTDANLHPGTSGSPVITKPKSTWIDDKGNTNLLTGTVYYLLGVHSGTVDASVTSGQTIGLGAAWYIQLVEDIATAK
jgi:hypothetical protein